jgi:predicted transcriptional regulator
MAAVTRDRLHELIDALGEDDIDIAGRVLAALVDDDPVGLSLALAPMDAEPLTDEDLAAIREGEAAIARGEVISHEELRRELGL